MRHDEVVVPAVNKVKTATARPGAYGPASRRTVASPTSAALAYTGFCLVTLLFALCLAKMPSIARSSGFAALRDLLS